MTKKCFFAAAILSIQVLLVRAQPQNSIFEDDTPVTWLGLDFTRASLIGDSDKFRSDTVIYNFMDHLKNGS
jgi:hypothetical protein